MIELVVKVVVWILVFLGAVIFLGGALIGHFLF